MEFEELFFSTLLILCLFTTWVHIVFSRASSYYIIEFSEVFSWPADLAEGVQICQISWQPKNER